MTEQHSSTGAGFNSWTLTSVRHWGEPAKGNWTVTVADLAGSNSGTLNALQLDLHGSILPSPAVSLTLSDHSPRPRLEWHLGAVGWSCGVEVSTNLLHWTSLGTVSLDTAGSGIYLDTVRNEAQRFYPIRLDP